MPSPSIHAFAEKVAVISDGENPIGRAVALQLALQGSYVIVGHPGGGGLSALAELKALGTLASVVEADASTPDGASAIAEAARSAFGRIDLLVNVFSSGTGRVSETARLLTEAGIGLLASRPKPKIVNVVRRGVGSGAGDLDEAVGLTGAMASDLGPRFRVNAVLAGERLSEEPRDLDPELFPPRTGIDPDDAARVVIFLLSAEAIGVNGQSIIVGK